MPPPLDLPRGAVVVQGRVAAVEALPEGQRVTLEGARIGDREPLPRTLRIRLRANDPARPAPGDMLAVRALLREPGAPVVPAGWEFRRAAAKVVAAPDATALAKTLQRGGVARPK